MIVPCLGIALLAVSGIVHGVQTGRWKSPVELSEAAARLNDLPRQLPGWRSQQLELSADQLLAAEASGGTALRYEPDGASQRHQSVEVMLLCGPFGPIAVHPPTVCFKGAGYRQLDEQKRVVVADAEGHRLGTFWSTEFERDQDGVPQRIRTWWGWSDGGAWMAPESARVTFAGSTVLHKVYLTEVVTSDDAESAIPNFAKVFLPRAGEVLFR